MPSSPSLTKRFTMVEIMVVTVIVSTIAVMLLPAVAKAREKAKHGRWAGQVSALRSDDGLVALYDFEDREGLTVTNKAVGADVADYAPELMDGVIDTAAILRWSTGRWQGKGAIEFGGAWPAYIEIPTTRFMDPQEGAIGVWALLDQSNFFSGNPHLFDCNSTSLPTKFTLMVDYDGQLIVNIGDQEWVSTGAYFEDRFHFSLLTWKEGTYQVYFDGKLMHDGTYTDFTTLPSFAGIGSMYGEDSSGNAMTGGSWVGLIDEVFIYNRQLTVDEAVMLHKMGSR